MRRVLSVVLLASLLFCAMPDVHGISSSKRTWPTLSHLRTKISGEDQAVAVKAMIGRVLTAGDVPKFHVVVNASLAEEAHDVFVFETMDNGQLRIEANTGVAASAGFHYYLKKYCGCHISWSGKQVSIPATLPVIHGPVKVVANDLFRYYQNVCTSGYSFVWWDWNRWEQEIDWMALNWINLPLAFNGQEEIYRRVYTKLGFSQEDLDEFFTGPAFLAWGRMGNIDRFGGPLPENWYVGQLHLQHLILGQMKGFGMIPVLPAFSGHVPKATQERFPEVNITRLAPWNKFNETYSSTYLLDHHEELFKIIGSNFINEMKEEFGVDHIYNTDTFNEMTPPSTDVEYVTAVGQSVFGAMTTADPQAVWLMQGWLFLNPFWTTDLARALLTSVPVGRMIVLDLHADVTPLYQHLESYFGQPFIWCMLHNFGGTKGLYGAVDNINRGPFDGRSFNNSTMIGTGLTPEGIEQNDVMYELMNEMAWRKEPVDVNDWVADYAMRRYGVEDANVTLAWQNLTRSVYNCSSGFSFRGQYVLVRRPSLNSSRPVCYDNHFLLKAFDLFLHSSLKNNSLVYSDLFQHDLVDMAREVLVAVVADEIYELVNLYFRAKDIDKFRKFSTLYLSLLEDLEKLLNTDRRFLLGLWLESAKSLAKDEQECALYEYNARNQITLWGPNGEIVDYANKQWAGVVSDYFHPRWSLFFDQVYLALNSSKAFDQKKFVKDVFAQVEQPFTFSRVNVSTVPQDSVVNVVARIHRKWYSLSIHDPDLNSARYRSEHARSWQRPAVYSRYGWMSSQWRESMIS